MKTSRNNACLAVLLAVSQAFYGCSHLTKQDLASEEDYAPALSAHFAGEHRRSIAVFPEKEQGGFITTVEKLWLNLLNGTPNIEQAVRVGSVLEERKTLRMSREAKSYFYQETEDGYYPAEHEAVLLHILAGFTFAASGRRAEARIEARRAAFYLQSEFGAERQFDDPALRLWLAALWVYCGEWQHARVDMRVAASLSKDYAFLRDLADKETPPESLALVLAGSGVQPQWRPEARANVVGGLSAIEFVPSYKAGQVSWERSSVGERSFPPPLSTLNWYERHQERDHVIRKSLEGSRYMLEAAGTASAATAARAIGIAAAVTVVAVGVAGGVVIIYYALQAGGELAARLGLGLGTLVALAGVGAGLSINSKSAEAAERIMDSGMNPVYKYRFVRFLPEYVYFDAGKAVPANGILADGKTVRPLYTMASPDERSRIQMYFVPGGIYRMQSRTTSDRLVLTAIVQEYPDWIATDTRLNFSQAVEFCQRESARTGKDYRVPTETQVKAGIADKEGQPALLKKRPTGETLWIKSAYSEGRSSDGCMLFGFNPDQARVNAPCDVRRHVLCREIKVIK